MIFASRQAAADLSFTHTVTTMCDMISSTSRGDADASEYMPFTGAQFTLYNFPARDYRERRGFDFARASPISPRLRIYIMR